MDLLEIPIVNTIFHMPFEGRIPLPWCPREEIVSPAKAEAALDALASPDQAAWNELTIGIGIAGIDPAGTDIAVHHMYQTIIPWEHPVDEYPAILAHYFYVVCDDVALWARVADVLRHPSQEAIATFLREDGPRRILFTTPVYSYGGMPFLVENRFPSRRVPVDELAGAFQQAVLSESFTIASGLVLLLALHRAGRIPSAPLADALAAYLGEDPPDIVPDAWMGLYQSHASPMVAECPLAFAMTGPRRAARPVLEALGLNDPPLLFDQLVQENSALWHIPLSYALPTLSPDLLPALAEGPLWLQAADDLASEGDRMLPDVYGFFHGIIRTARTWAWWREPSHRRRYLRQLRGIARTAHAYLDLALPPLFHLYRAQRYARHHRYGRVRQMMRDVMGTVDGRLLSTWIFRYTVERATRTEAERQDQLLYLDARAYPPVGFLRDAAPSLDFFRRCTCVVKHRFPLIFRTVYPQATLLALRDGVRVFRLCASLYQIWKEEFPNSPFAIFRTRCIEDPATRVLWAIDVGMHQRSSHDGPNYEVGMVLKEWLRDHRDQMVQV